MEYSLLFLFSYFLGLSTVRILRKRPKKRKVTVWYCDLNPTDLDWFVMKQDLSYRYETRYGKEIILN